MIEDVLMRLWQNLLSRPAGPLKFRFLLQPAVAILLAVYTGLHDSRTGKPPFLWAVVFDPANRRSLMRDAWQSIGRVFEVALALDCVYQIVVLRWIYPFEALVVAFFLSIVPYALVRGPVNRLTALRRIVQYKSAAGRN